MRRAPAWQVPLALAAIVLPRVAYPAVCVIIALALSVGPAMAGSTIVGPTVRASRGALVVDEAATRATSAVDPSSEEAAYEPLRIPSSAPRAIIVPRGSPVTVVRDAQDVELAIIEAAREFGQDPALMLCVARAESGLRVDLLGAAGERGLMQFLPRTWGYYERGPGHVAHWTGNSAALGYGEQDVWLAIPAARVAASMWQAGQQSQWHTYPGCAR